MTVFLAACAPLPQTGAGQKIPHRIRVSHPGLASDGPKTYTLYQINDAMGFPSEYTMEIDSVICPEQTCKVIRVHMTWDALGRYQRYRLPPGEVLEKGQPSGQKAGKAWTEAAWKGVPFTEADYLKLEDILKDSASLLGRQKAPGPQSLHNAEAVDGLTGATPAALRDAVVAGASLTCYNLWHWANGEVAAAAKELTHRQCGEAMLLGYLSSGKPHYALFALEHLTSHRLFSPSAAQAVCRAMGGGDRDRIDLGLAYLREAQPDRDSYFASVGHVILSATGEGRAYLLDRLSAERTLPEPLLETLGEDLPNWKNYYEIHLFLRLAERHGHGSRTLAAQTAKLLDSADFFIARRAYGYLSGQTGLDSQTAGRLEAFREKAMKEGRNL